MDQESVRKSNRMAILDMVRRYETASRIQIVKELAISKATVTDIVNDLIAEGIIVEIDHQDSVMPVSSKGGRRAVQLALSQGPRYIIGVDLGTKNLSVGIANFKGILEWSNTTITSRDHSVAAIVNQIGMLMNLGLSKLNIPRDAVIGLGIAVPGTISPEMGTVEHSYFFDWVDVPLQRIIEKATGIPAVINNSTRTMALGELWYGVARETNNLFYINVGNGIGSAIVLEGKLYDHHSEFGHIVITNKHVKCNCGNYGCLEAVASGQAIEREGIAKLSEDFSGQLTGEILMSLAEAGNEKATKIFMDAGRYIGRACSIIGNTMNPEKIVIGGGVTLAGDLLLKSIESEFKNHMRGDLERHTKIIMSRFGLSAGLRGAVALAISKLVF